MTQDGAKFGVYVHYPWCRRRCSYCDFAIAVAPTNAIPHDLYREAVLAELDAEAAGFGDRRLESIYFGGGTPSIWPPDHLAAVISAITARFGGTPREVTLEANPTDCDPDTLARWQQAGITRVSVGLQSVRPAELALLQRDHSMGDGQVALDAVLAAGFHSVTADVILAVPAGGDGGLDTVRAVAATGVPHLSVYELTVEDRTPLARRVARGQVVPLAESRRAELYTAAHDSLTGAGYDHYEISSYARPGHRAVHNSLYWQCAEFLGLGNGAASFRRDGPGGVRWTNPRSVGRYLRGTGDRERVELTAQDVADDRLWLGMRTADGAQEAAFADRDGLAERLIADGLAERDRGRIRPTLRGFLLADEVARRVVVG